MRHTIIASVLVLIIAIAYNVSVFISYKYQVRADEIQAYTDRRTMKQVIEFQKYMSQEEGKRVAAIIESFGKCK